MKNDVFHGIKVVSFGWAVTGPLTMKYLVNYGATVIKVESEKRPDVLRVSPPFKVYNG